jgi:hypothetical protein
MPYVPDRGDAVWITLTPLYLCDSGIARHGSAPEAEYTCLTRVAVTTFAAFALPLFPVQTP